MQIGVHPQTHTNCEDPPKVAWFHLEIAKLCLQLKTVIEAFSAQYGSDMVLEVSCTNIQDSFHRSTAFPYFCTMYKQRIIHSYYFPRPSRRSSRQNPFLRFVEASLTTMIERLKPGCRVRELQVGKMVNWWYTIRSVWPRWLVYWGLHNHLLSNEYDSKAKNTLTKPMLMSFMFDGG